MTALESVRPCELPEIDPRVEAALADWRKEGREIVNRAMEKGEMVLDGACAFPACGGNKRLEHREQNRPLY